MTDSGSSPDAKQPATKKKRPGLSWIAVLVAIPVILIGRLFLNGIVSNPLANPCTFETRSYQDLGSSLYGPLMRMKFRASYPQDKVLVMPLTSGSDPGDVPANAVENPCDGRRFMAGIVNRLDAYAPAVIAIDRFYDDDDRCPESTGANDALRVALSSAQAYAQIPIPAVLVGLDSGKATEQQATTTGGNCLIDKKPLDLSAKAIPAARVRRPIHLGLVRMNEDVLRIPLRWWLTAGPAEDRSAAGFALAGYALDSGPLTPDDLHNLDSGVPLSPYPIGLKRLLNTDAHPYAFFPRSLPKQVSPIDLFCADAQGQDFLRRFLLGIHEPQSPIPSTAGHPEQAYCRSAKPFPNLGGKVVVIGVREEDVDTHPFPGGQQFGVDLQADYIEALLDNAYIKTAPGWLDWGLTVVLCILLLGREVMPEYITAKWWITLAWDVGVIAAVMVLSIVALFFGFFTPVFWLACSGVVLTDVFTRLFERITHHVREKREVHAG